MVLDPYPWSGNRKNTSNRIAGQTESTYLDHMKIKGFEDVGYFLIYYIVSGGIVTPNATRNDMVDATKIVVSLNDDIMAREGAIFQTSTPNTTYYLDFLSSGDWSWGTVHPVGAVDVDYLTIAEVSTDASGLVSAIADARQLVGGFRLKDAYGLEDYMRKGSIVFNVKDYGAIGNGTVDDSGAIQAAITAASAVGGIVFSSGGTYKVSANLSAPQSVTLMYTSGAVWSIDSGVTLNINGTIEAPMNRIFSGSGLVRGNLKNDRIYPQWWGAIADGATDSSPAINSAIATAQASTYGPIVVLPPGSYLIVSTIVIQHGSYPRMCNITGYGVRLIAGTVGMTMFRIKSFGSKETFQNIGQTRIFGINFYAPGANSTAIYMGKLTSDANDAGLDGGPQSIIKDCLFENFQNGVVQSESRLWVYEDCLFSSQVAGAIGISFIAPFGGFCGDTHVDKCQVGVIGSGTGIKIVPTTPEGSSSLGTCNGIRINNSVMYGGGGVDIAPADAQSWVQDLWITNCAFDGTVSGTAINGYSQAYGNIGPVQINNVWINGYIYGIVTYNCFGVAIIGGKISSVDGEAIRLNASRDCKVVGVTCVDTNRTGSSNGVIKLTGPGLRNKIETCSVVNVTGSIVIIVDPGQDKFYIVGNSATGGTIVTNNAGGSEGTNFTLFGNL